MKQTVEESAMNFANYESNNLDKLPFKVKNVVDYDNGITRGFKAGAEWQSKQSPWISVEERLPEELTSVLVRSEYEGKSLYEVAFVINGKWKCRNGKPTHWTPIPSFDQILEANKYVLQRMKEKED